MQSLTVDDIKSMSYVDFISLLRETNCCPGGKRTIFRIIQSTFINSQSKVLEIGCNTGFTSLEIARTSKSNVLGIDISEVAVSEANKLLGKDTQDVQDRVTFKTGSSLDIEAKSNYFDLVVAGGATTFMDAKTKAIEEYHRVLKPWGFLSITNFCYLTPPPDSLVQKVSDIIGVNINPWSYEQWCDLFNAYGAFEVYINEKYNIEAENESTVREYVSKFLEKDHLRTLTKPVRDSIYKRWLNTIQIFNRNHEYLGYAFLILRKRHLEEEPELFKSITRVA